MHHLDSNKTVEKKLNESNIRNQINKSWKQYPAKQQLYDIYHPSNRQSQLDKQDMLANAAEQPLTSHLKNHLIKMNQTCWAM